MGTAEMVAIPLLEIRSTGGFLTLPVVSHYTVRDRERMVLITNQLSVHVGFYVLLWQTMVSTGEKIPENRRPYSHIRREAVCQGQNSLDKVGQTRIYHESSYASGKTSREQHKGSEPRTHHR